MAVPSTHTHGEDVEVRCAEVVAAALAYKDRDASEGSNESKHLDRVIKAAQDLVRAAEDPKVTLFNIISGLNVHAAIRVAIEMGVFKHLPKTGGIKSKELAELLDVDEVLLIRIMRALCASTVVYEAGLQEYRATRMSEFLCILEVEASIKHWFDDVAFCLLQVPAYLKKTKFQNPTDAGNGPFQYAFQTDLHPFGFYAKHRDRAAAFNLAMGALETWGLRTGGAVRPLSELLDPATTPDEVFLVDVGGGKGHCLRSIIQTDPGLKGRVVLQDLPDVVPESFRTDRENVQVEVMAHDFFDPQPVVGASAYYLRFILHDWPNDQGRAILRQIRAAMRKGHSKLLIGDCVMPDKGASLAYTHLDMSMISLASMERTESQWRALLGEAGFKITDIVTPNTELAVESLIIAELDS